MNRPASRAVAIGVAAAMACATLVAVPHMAQAQPEAQTNAKKDVQVIAFQQTWNTVAKECTSTYGPEGVAYVEVSPPQESIQGTQWWTSYQPVSYKLDSKLGTEAEFKNMIKQCNAVGVDIIADVVLNQTTGADVADGKQTGVAGTNTTVRPATTRDLPPNSIRKASRLRLPQLLQEHLQLRQPAGSPGMPPELHVGLRLRERKGPGYSI